MSFIIVFVYWEIRSIILSLKLYSSETYQMKLPISNTDIKYFSTVVFVINKKKFKVTPRQEEGK